jgi:transposase
MRIIGMDISRAFAELVVWEEGQLRRTGRVDMRRDMLEAFARKLKPDDVVVLEATGNSGATVEVLKPHVAKVVVANPKQVRLIAHAKIKTDIIDASVLAQLYAAGFLPEVWVPDGATAALRRQVTHRNQIVKQRSRLKNIIHSILHAHLIPSGTTRTTEARRPTRGQTVEHGQRGCHRASMVQPVCRRSLLR